jgi:phosphoribosylanthranilate isomerase
MYGRLLVKVCGMRDVENTRLIAERCAPDYLGFIFASSSPRCIDQALCAELVRVVPATVRLVGVFRDNDPSEIEAVARRFKFSAVQLHGAEDSDYIAGLKSRLPSCYIFKAISIPANNEAGDILANLPQGADLFIFDSSAPGSGVEFNWGTLSRYRGSTPYLLAGGIGPHSAERALSFARQNRLCIGVDINSRVELSVGIKDENLVGSVLQKIVEYANR